MNSCTNIVACRRCDINWTLTWIQIPLLLPLSVLLLFPFFLSSLPLHKLQLDLLRWLKYDVRMKAGVLASHKVLNATESLQQADKCITHLCQLRKISHFTNNSYTAGLGAIQQTVDQHTSAGLHWKVCMSAEKRLLVKKLLLGLC